MNVIIAFLALLKQQRERPENSGLSRYCLSSAKRAMIKFIHSTPHFKYKSLYYHHQ